jgi:outer membrane lipoprotein-sorting protein
VEESAGDGSKERGGKRKNFTWSYLMFRFSIFILCFSLLTLIGCRTTRPLNLGDRSVSYSEVQEVTRSHHAHIHSMLGEGRISVETPEIAQSGSFTLTLQKPDSVLINLRGPFGIKVGSALVTRTGFLFYNSLENKLITGLSSVENLNRILHVQLSFDDLLNLFAGGAFLENDFHAPDETYIENDQFVFVFTSSKTSRKYWIEPTTLNIQKVQFLDQSGKLALEQTFNNFEDVNGFAMPYTIRVIQPKARQRLTFTYSEILVNTEQLHFTFTIPPNAERIHW